MSYEELPWIDPQGYARKADRFPVGGPPFKALMEMQSQLDARLEEQA